MNQAIEKKLNKQTLINKRFELVAVLTMILGIVAIAASVIVAMDSKTTSDYIIYGIFGVIAAAPFVNVIFPKLADYVEQKYFPAYIIINEDGVRKVYGSVPVKDNHVYKKLLVKNYKIFNGNAYDVYGCTMAAVPCSKGDEKVKEQLKDLGLNISTKFG